MLLIQLQSITEAVVLIGQCSKTKLLTGLASPAFMENKNIGSLCTNDNKCSSKNMF